MGSDKNLIVKVENLPRIGDRVVDEQFKPVGRVFDIFGPVAAPYAAVKPQGKEPRYWINRILFSSSLSKSETRKGVRRNG